MCNLYSITTTTEAMQRLRAEWERAMRNTPPLYRQQRQCMVRAGRDYPRGLQTYRHGVRRKEEGPLDHELFAFFTTKPHDVVGAIHPKAMPVILRTEEEWDVWLRAP
ncbi:MAG TPA: hypothetical protein VGN80_01265 [Devosiaceae bacterium]|nr:hypothetical protein [Devosiaceae bacterium]